ncbi:MAG: S8 family peptidase [Bacteroidia bacterium]
MERFPHLKFSENIVGRARFKTPTGAERSKENKENRQGHSQDLLRKTSVLSSEWINHVSERETLGFATLDENIQPIFLQINEALLSDFKFDLQSFGIEIISEEENGFIIGASLDNLRSLEEKIRDFVSAERGSGRIADLWQIIDGSREEWKPKHILSPELLEKWNTIDDFQTYNIEVSIAFDKPVGKEPDATKRGGQTRLKKYREKLIKRDEFLGKRQTHFEEFIKFYNAEILSSFIELEDSFGCQISINGKGLKDLVVNYPFVFEVGEIEEIAGTIGTETETADYNLEILSPLNNAPEIGVIDSGIMENHRFLEKAIKPENSKSYVDNDSSTSDMVTGGGHGTKVAGAILYPNGVSHLSGVYQLPCFVRNLRVLNNDNKLERKFPAELMQEIVEDNSDCRVFNLSINSNTPFRKKHMSLWAATLDKLIHENNILFVASAGNISKEDIRHYIQNGAFYPDYLSHQYCRLANPGQSSFSIVVGSINHLSLDNDNWKSLGNENEIAPYSRVGTGIWGHIKPDVVEYGGGMQVSKDGANNISYKDTAIELVRSTLHGGGAFNKESVGTSFATPKVTQIVAELLKLYKEEGINLIRALLIQGARLLNVFFHNPTTLSIQHFGYGIPSLQRVTENTEHRVTFYSTNNITAEEGQIYSLKIPQELRSQGDEYDILVEVTLAYTAKNRRTRQRTKSYLSTWLDWESSNLDDDYEKFKNRTLSELEGKKITEFEKSSGNIIKWKIREQKNWGIEGISRNQSSLQKDWVVLKSYDLPEELHFAVKAHKGWDINKESIPYAITVSVEILGTNISIYESIRIENGIEISV